MGEVSDERLFERLVAGDQEALRPLMERYGDALTLYVNGYVHDIDAAEDPMLEAFSRLLVKRPRLREDLCLNPGNVYAYLAGDDTKVRKETARRIMRYADG